MRLRSAVITSIYSKALVISASVLLRRTTGEITNLMSVDSSRLQDLTPYMHAIWYSFYQIIWALYFLWQQVGISALAGVFVIVLTIPLTNRIATVSKKLQKKISTVRDERVKMSNEVLSGMKVIKFQAWEKECEGRLGKIREKELSLFWDYCVVQCLSGALYATVPLLVEIGRASCRERV
jgi:ATP-binding cassette subfamily C (CFTR/MRP) protein 1